MSPSQGTVPAHGCVEVEVSFTPALLRTEEWALEVCVAEFNASPVVCTVTGYSLPGLSKEAIFLEATGTANPDMVGERESVCV